MSNGQGHMKQNVLIMPNLQANNFHFSHVYIQNSHAHIRPGSENKRSKHLGKSRISNDPAVSAKAWMSQIQALEELREKTKEK